MASVRARPQGGFRTWEDEESGAAIAPSDTRFMYRLVWANGKPAGRAAYRSEIKPGNIILNYRGQWLRVLGLRPLAPNQEATYDGVLEVELT